MNLLPSRRWLAVCLTLGLLAQTACGTVNKLSDKLRNARIANPVFEPSGGWEPFLTDSVGERRQLLLPVGKNTDRMWMGLGFTKYDGPRMRLAVMRVENKVGPYLEVPLEQIEELVTTAMFRTNRFDVIERKRIGDVVLEQDFGASGRVSEETAPEIGSILGAEYMIVPAVNEWTPNRRNRSGGFGGITAGQGQAEVAMSFRVVDTTSSRVVFSHTARATATNWNLGLQGTFDTDTNSPVNYAVQACINKATYHLARWFEERPWRGSVIQIEGDSVWINAGSLMGIERGMEMTAMSKGSELIDPETGLSLGAQLMAIGSVQVIAVQDNYSVGTVIQGCEGLKPGDRLELQGDEVRRSVEPREPAGAEPGGAPLEVDGSESGVGSPN